ncbi:uncharacterized protein LOC128397471 [Panonychus citri]|uniref:uncharacterized protein LOC128397471 n=1 Tax=Panonychus citri TaxID=50023 RepID=UPI002307F878|nr:uncharacterized protein LOC128397471 [Panonychus citri]
MMVNNVAVFATLFFVLISVPTSYSQPPNQGSGIAVFSSASDNQPDTQPSWQLIFRNIGLGSMTDPVFNILKRRWDSIRTNPFIQAFLLQNSPAAAAPAPSTGNVMRYARSVNRRTRREYQPTFIEKLQ